MGGALNRARQGSENMKGRLRAALGMAVFAGLLVSAASAMAASIIYGSAYIGTTGAATLYTISPTTGAATAIGPIGFEQVGSLDFCPNGVLYGIGKNAGGTTILLTINTATAAGTLVGALGVNTNFQDVACRSDGTLYANASGSNGNMYTVNTATGVATLLGGTGEPVDGDATAFSSANVLYSANQTNLGTINQFTGAFSPLVALTYPVAGSRANGMKFDPASGTLYASVASVTSPLRGNYFATINIVSGAVTEIGPTVAGLDAIAIAGAAPAIPALSPAALALLLGSLLLSGLFLLRRRQ